MLCRIVKEEGVAGLFRGATPTIVRAMALNMGMLASNEQVGLQSCVCPRVQRRMGIYPVDRSGGSGGCQNKPTTSVHTLWFMDL